MSKIHPAENQGRHRPSRHLTTPIPDHPLRPGPSPSVLTVWKKSSMSFQGTDGFTVFDHCGRLVFRVDNYTRKSWAAASAGLLLMDGSGKGLLTLKPQVPTYHTYFFTNPRNPGNKKSYQPTSLFYSLPHNESNRMLVYLPFISFSILLPKLLSVQHQWTGYRGEDNRCSRAFTMRRPPPLLIPRSACEAEVFIGENIKETSERKPDLKAEGSFRRRNCKIVTTATGELVAQISRKRINTTLLLSDDVFTLVVHPGFEPDLVMAFVIILDRICRQTNYAPILCS